MGKNIFLKKSRQDGLTNLDDILIIRQPHTREEFELMYELRWKVLRKPWNQPKGSEKDAEEAKSIPFIAILGGEIIGTARLHKINDSVAQVRYLAVAENYCLKGVGRQIMEAIHVSARNSKYLILNARETAIKFFEKLGYQVIAEGPLLFGTIKHKKMVFQLSGNDLRLQSVLNNLRKTAALIPDD